MESKLFVGVISVFVAIVVLAGVLMPVINEAAGSETTIHIINEDSSTLKLQKLTSNFALDLSVTTDGDSNLVVSNGNDSIVADPNESMYILATDSAAIYYDQGDMVFIWTDENGTSERLLTNPFTAVIDEGKLTVDDGTATDAPLPSTFMFAPSSNGQYGSFTVADLNLVPDDPVIAAGSFAGVYCYNQHTTLGNDLQEYVTVSDDVLTEVIWAATADDADQQLSIEPFDPLQIDFDPIDFNPIDPNENIIMAVPTPTYTDGDWGYDVSNGKAIIVSYSGAGGGPITVPSKVGGYDVITFGKTSGSDRAVFPSGFTATDLIISEGITKISYDAVYYRSGFTGSLVLPSTLTSIESEAFGDTGFTGSLVLPDGLTTTGTYCFQNCTGFTGSLVLPGSLTSIGTNSFKGCTGIDSLVVLTSVAPGQWFTSTGIKEVLNLSSNTWTTTTGGLNADEVRTDIAADLYIAPSDVAITVGSPSAFAPLLNVIPLIIIMSILMMIVGYTMIRRSY